MDFILQYWPIILAFIAGLIWLVRLEGKVLQNKETNKLVEKNLSEKVKTHEETVKSSLETHQNKVTDDLKRIERNFEKSLVSIDKKVDTLQVKHDSLDSKIVEQLTDVRESLARIEGAMSISNKQ